MKEKMACKVFSNILAEYNEENLINDCKLAFTSRSIQKNEKYSQGTTFFLPSNQKPNCNLEKLAKAIFEQHTKDLEFNPETSGAEWWVMYLHTIDDIGFHWDRDYGLEIEEKKLVHPFLGTVTYLSNIGGPTVVLDMDGTLPAEQFDGYEFKQCYVNYPKFGKHITFNGKLLHGAPSTLHPTDEEEEESEGEGGEDETSSETEDSIPETEARITFLVNIWLNHLPSQAEVLPNELLSTLCNDQAQLQLEFNSQSVQELNCDDLSSDQLTTSDWRLDSNETNYSIQIPVPEKELLQKDSQLTGESFHFQFDEHKGYLFHDEDDEDCEDEDCEEDEEKTRENLKRNRQEEGEDEGFAPLKRQLTEGNEEEDEEED